MKFVQARNYYSGGNKPTLIVIHDMEYPERPTGAEWCADFFAGLAGGPAPHASAHYCIDNDSIVQCVRETDGAWHCPGSLGGVEVNRMSIGIEHAGYAKQTAAEWMDDYSMAMLELSAEHVARLCAKWGISHCLLTEDDLKAGRRNGITTHAALTKATGKGSHWDPGPHFPYDWYIARVEAYGALIEAGPPEPVMDRWVEVECNGEVFEVAQDYIWPISIGGAQDMAKELGCMLPSPDLVDAIWRAADCKVPAEAMSEVHDGTMAGMSSLALINRHAVLYNDAVMRFANDPGNGLVAGTCKDVVERNGVLGIYGWHRSTGNVVQGFNPNHVRGWIDYSQGLRLVRRKAVA